MPDFRMAPNAFPIASVIQAAQENANRQQQNQQYGQQQLLQGLQTIGAVGQSLVDHRRAMAQAMTMGQQLGMNPAEIQGLTPDQVQEIGKIKASQMDSVPFFKGIATISGQPDPFGLAPPSANGQPPTVPGLPSKIGGKTAEMLLKMANDTRMANQFNRGQAQSENHFQTEEGRKTSDKIEQIVKETEDKDQAIHTAANAIQQSLNLKRQASSGPITGRVAAMVGNLTGGAVGNNTYQLVQHNMRNAPTLQHAQDVNRFNPQEVQYLSAANFAQPAEPLGVSEQKAFNAANTFATRLTQNELEKAQKLKALGVNYTPRTFKPEDLIPGLSPQASDQTSVPTPQPVQQPPGELVHLSTKDLLALRDKLSAHQQKNGNKP